MKKFIVSLLVTIFLGGIIPATAQVKFGVKGGVNFNKADASGLLDTFKSERKAGFFIGPMVDIGIPIGGLGVDGSVLFSQRNLKIKNDELDKKVTNHQNAIEIPVNLKYSIGLDDLASIFLAVGPDFIFNLNDNDLLGDLSNITGINRTNSSTNKMDFAINVGFGVKLLYHWQVGVNWNIPLTNNVKQDNEYMADYGSIFNGKEFKSKNKTWQLSLAYLF